jgi:ABC-2 type transport system permease protein
MLRVGLAEAVAYRAEMIVWVLSYTMPLIMLALWAAVARDAPVGRYDQRDFAAYFLTTLVVRMLVASWVVWEMTMEIRQGSLAMRMLRPIHPLVAFSAQNLGAIPLRFAMGVPVLAGTFAFTGLDVLSGDPVQWLTVPFALAGAWLMTFLVQCLVGMLAFYWDSSLSLYDLFLGFYLVGSGYVMPLDLVPSSLGALVQWLPFRYMLSLPVESMLGLCDRAASLQGLAVQWTYVAALLALTALMWRRAARSFAAFGG